MFIHLPAKLQYFIRTILQLFVYFWWLSSLNVNAFRRKEYSRFHGCMRHVMGGTWRKTLHFSWDGPSTQVKHCSNRKHTDQTSDCSLSYQRKWEKALEDSERAAKNELLERSSLLLNWAFIHENSAEMTFKKIFLNYFLKNRSAGVNFRFFSVIQLRADGLQCDCIYAGSDSLSVVSSCDEFDDQQNEQVYLKLETRS